VFNTLGHVPVEGDHIVTHGWRFTVREMEGRRIKRVEIAREVDAANGELVDADS
jgi:CBS domain containing-hemolysin-like protein